MRSDSELQIFTFRSKKKTGLLNIQSDIIAKSDGTKSSFENPMAQGVRSDASARRILKSKNGIGLSSRKNVTEQSLVQQQYEVHTDVCTSNDRCVGLRI